jgi:hypothetical protein
MQPESVRGRMKISRRLGAVGVSESVPPSGQIVDHSESAPLRPSMPAIDVVDGIIW